MMSGVDCTISRRGRGCWCSRRSTRRWAIVTSASGVAGAPGQQPGGPDGCADARLCEQPAEQTLGHGGTALVGGADEQDVDARIVGVAPAFLTVARPVSFRDVRPRRADGGSPRARPVLVGAGQWSNRADRGEPAVEPADLMAEALRRAAADSGAGRGPAGKRRRRARRADVLRRYRNAARLVAERIGARPRDEAVSPVGGNEPQALVSQACLDIAAGDADTVLICGGEAWRTRSSAPRRAGLD